MLSPFFNDNDILKKIDYDIFYLTPYYPYWLEKETKIRNPKFDINSEQILNFKKMEDSAITYYREVLDKILTTYIYICAIPSHDPANIVSGITYLIKLLCKNRVRFNTSFFIVRKNKIDAFHEGGKRSVEIQFKSLEINPNIKYSLKGKTVLLLDDVYTTGYSISACKKLLLEKARVKKFAALTLGKTTY